MNISDSKPKQYSFISPRLNSSFNFRRTLTHSIKTSKDSSKLSYSIKLKQKLLHDQIIKAQQASFNLHSHIKFQKILTAHNSRARYLDCIRNEAATKIQKVFRGFYTRLLLLRSGVDVEKKILHKLVIDMQASIDHIFFSSKMTLQVIKNQAVIQIQRAFRLYLKRKLIYNWINAANSLKKRRIALRKIRGYFGMFKDIIVLKEEKLKAQKTNKILEIKKNLALYSLKTLWNRLNLNYKTLMDNIARHKKNAAEIKENNQAFFLDRDSPFFSALNKHVDKELGGENPDLKKGQKKNIIIKRSKQEFILPNISVTPKNKSHVNLKNQQFLNNTKRATSENKINSERVNKIEKVKQSPERFLQRLPKLTKANLSHF